MITTATGLIGAPSLALALEKRGAGDEGDNDRDEAGCHLRSIIYNEQKLCIPGNIASMLVIAQQASKCELVS